MDTWMAQLTYLLFGLHAIITVYPWRQLYWRYSMYGNVIRMQAGLGFDYIYQLTPLKTDLKIRKGSCEEGWSSSKDIINCPFVTTFVSFSWLNCPTHVNETFPMTSRNYKPITINFASSYISIKKRSTARITGVHFFRPVM